LWCTNVLVTLQRQKFYFSEEEKVKKLLSPSLFLVYFAFRRLAHSQQPRRLSFQTNKKKEKGNNE